MIEWAAVVLSVLAAVWWLRVIALVKSANQETRGSGGIMFAAYYTRRIAYWLSGAAVAAWAVKLFG